MHLVNILEGGQRHEVNSTQSRIKVGLLFPPRELSRQAPWKSSINLLPLEIDAKYLISYKHSNRGFSFLKERLIDKCVISMGRKWAREQINICPSNQLYIQMSILRTFSIDFSQYVKYIY